MKRYSLMYHPPTMANDDCGDYVLYREARAEIDELKKALESMTAKYSDLLISRHKVE